MSTIKVISGKYKGRRIPFKNNIYDNADITSQKVKEALFSIIDPVIKNSTFLDLFAASGQIGLEALSRDSSFVVFNDLDKKRYEFIKKNLDAIEINKDKYVVVNFHFEHVLRWLSNKENKFDIIYADPPYTKNKTGEVYVKVLSLISTLGLLKAEGIVAVQHDAGSEPPERVNNLTITKTKKYGRTSLTIYTQET